MTLRNTYKFIESKLRDEVSVALYIVIDSKGSAPGKKGFRLAMSEDGERTGTIGGGIMEKTLEDKVDFSETKSNLFSLSHNKNASNGYEESGLICSGEQRILLCYFQPSHLGMIENFLSNEFILAFKKDSIFLSKKKTMDDDILYQEIKQKSKCLYIFGGGHVGSAVARVASGLDFEIKVFDDRVENNILFSANGYEKIISPESEVGGFISEDTRNFGVVVSKSLTSDVKYLKEVYHHNFEYIGLMGSKAKIQNIKTELSKHDLDLEKYFDKIHTPIGLSIKAETPHEIAISICAELIEFSKKIQV